MRIIFIALVALLILGGCTQSGTRGGEENDSNPLPEEKKERITEAKKIQADFEEAYISLHKDIRARDQKSAQKDYGELVGAYERAKEKAGEAHLQFMVEEENLNRLGEEVSSGEFGEANETLSTIAGSCGVSVCHQRSGGSMANLEYEYSEIKGAIGEGDLDTAREHLPEFKKYFNQSKQKTSKFLPRLTEEKMKDEYVNNLEEALQANNTEGARKAIKVISEKTCSLEGCHAIFLS